MKKLLVRTLIVLSLSVGTLYALTGQTGLRIINSVIDSTTIGLHTAAAAIFTDLQSATAELATLTSNVANITTAAINTATISTGNVTTLTASTTNTGTLKVNGIAPNGHILVGNGNSYVDALSPTLGAVCAGVNCYVRLSDNFLIEKGSVTMYASGNSYNTVSITFPVAFTQTPSFTFSSVGQASNSGDPSTPPCSGTLSRTTSGASVFFARCVVASAGGGNFDNAMTIDWHASGY